MRTHLPALLLFATAPLAARAQERLPPQVAGTWRIVRILPVHGNACWTEQQAQPLVGSLLQYSPTRMRWQGGVVPLTGVITRSVTSKTMAREGEPPNLADLGIQAQVATEVDMQHDDADITGSTTEVPGDSVLIAGPGRIIVSACGIYMEARRLQPRSESAHKGL